MNTENQDLAAAGAQFSLADRWISSRLKDMLGRVETGFADYRLDVVANAVYEFTWHEFCDWYVELSKTVLQSDTASEAAKRGTRMTLIKTLEVLLRAMHPLAPFISEEIWQRVRVLAGVGGETIMRAEFPRAESIGSDRAAEPEMRWVMDFILGVRQIHGEMDIPLARKFEVLLQNASARDLEYLERNLQYLVRLGGVEAPRALKEGEAAPISAVALLGNLEILVPMKGLIDPVAELERLAKRLRKAEIDMSKLEAKLGNSQFAKNAPPDIVAKDQQRLEELRTEIGQLSAQTARVTKLKNQ
jgi:valyl-tRNA synthetase